LLYGTRIVARIPSGTEPVDLTIEEPTKRIDLPLSWTEQRELLRFGYAKVIPTNGAHTVVEN